MLNSRNLKKFGLSLLLFSWLSTSASFAQEIIKPKITNYTFLQKNSTALYTRASTDKLDAIAVAKIKGWEISRSDSNGTVIKLQRLDDAGLPIYFVTNNNIIAARTTRTDQLYNGGRLGLALNGSTIGAGKVAIWDGESVLGSHVEFAGNRIEVKDNNTKTAVHSTHVAGTMIAAGLNPNARGMAYGLPKLYSFDFDNDTPEMSANAANLLISNHSYGVLAGWALNTEVTPQRWEFYGAPDANEDYKFGYYDTQSSEWDKICYNAPYYLPVKSAGNNRSFYGPAVGTVYYRYNAGRVMTNAGPRPAGISSNDGYDNIPTYGTAKNILTVGAVNPVIQGLYAPANIQITSFSSWGPTDDGRIKPDLVADGVRVTSTSNASTNSYTSLSGTSMATPNVSGSLILLQELYGQKNQHNYMRAATLKALAIGTAAEAGAAAGPDYSYGWGLLNTEAAAQAIVDNGTKSRIIENIISQGEHQSIEVSAAGQLPLIATICWTDPEATAISSLNGLNNTSSRLMNDLDLRADKDLVRYKPWVLDPANPAAAATTGDNTRDNVEQVLINNAVAGAVYSFKISHKGTLKRGPQAYSIVFTGINSAGIISSQKTAEDGFNLSLYPVPAVKEINVSFNVGITSNVELRIINLQGQELYLEKRNQFNGLYYSQINLSGYVSGLYFVVLKVGDNHFTKKFLYTK